MTAALEVRVTRHIGEFDLDVAFTWSRGCPCCSARPARESR